ncbi:hypothetical protein MC885_020393, partial [Smutsia gigantea]
RPAEPGAGNRGRRGCERGCRERAAGWGRAPACGTSGGTPETEVRSGERGRGGGAPRRGVQGSPTACGARTGRDPRLRSCPVPLSAGSPCARPSEAGMALTFPSPCSPDFLGPRCLPPQAPAQVRTGPGPASSPAPGRLSQRRDALEAPAPSCLPLLGKRLQPALPARVTSPCLPQNLQPSRPFPASGYPQQPFSSPLLNLPQVPRPWRLLLPAPREPGGSPNMLTAGAARNPSIPRLPLPWLFGSHGNADCVTPAAGRARAPLTCTPAYADEWRRPS